MREPVCTGYKNTVAGTDDLADSEEMRDMPDLSLPTIPTDFLYRGLPCIWDGNRYLVFSPYALKVARVERDALDLNATRLRLQDEGFFGDPVSPEAASSKAEIGLILTTGCNLRCKYCYVLPSAQERLMSSELAVRAIRERIDTGSERISVSFFGGEPTLNMEALRAAVEYVKSLGIPHRFIINTNGTSSESDLDYLVSNDFIFSVSSDGPPAVTDIQRTAADQSTISSAVERTIKRLVDAGALLQVRATVTRDSLASLAEGMRYWGDLGVQFVHIEPVWLSRNGPDTLSCPDPDEYVSALRRAVDEAQRRRIWVITSAYMNLLTPSTYFCTTIAGEKELHTPDGEISVCYRVQSQEDGDSGLLVGEYDLTTDAFVRDTSRIEQLRQISMGADGPCVACHARYICGGGCPYANKIETGDMTKPGSWNCTVKRALVHDAVLRLAGCLDNGEPPVVLGQAVFEGLADAKYSDGGGCLSCLTP